MTNGFVTFAEIKVKERRVPSIKSIKIRLSFNLIQSIHENQLLHKSEYNQRY